MFSPQNEYKTQNLVKQDELIIYIQQNWGKIDVFGRIVHTLF